MLDALPEETTKLLIDLCTTTPLTSSEKEQFTALYLQRATQEFAEDLDSVRGRDDFKDDALSMLCVHVDRDAKNFEETGDRKL